MSTLPGDTATSRQLWYLADRARFSDLGIELHRTIRSRSGVVPGRSTKCITESRVKVPFEPIAEVGPGQARATAMHAPAPPETTTRSPRPRSPPETQRLPPQIAAHNAVSPRAGYGQDSPRETGTNPDHPQTPPPARVGGPKRRTPPRSLGGVSREPLSQSRLQPAR